MESDPGENSPYFERKMLEWAPISHLIHHLAMYICKFVIKYVFRFFFRSILAHLSSKSSTLRRNVPFLFLPFSANLIIKILLPVNIPTISPFLLVYFSFHPYSSSPTKQVTIFYIILKCVVQLNVWILLYINLSCLFSFYCIFYVVFIVILKITILTKRSKYLQVCTKKSSDLYFKTEGVVRCHMWSVLQQ